jgi:hypothetical protein
VLALYVLTLVAREKRIQKQMENLKRIVEDKEAK